MVFLRNRPQIEGSIWTLETGTYEKFDFVNEQGEHIYDERTEQKTNDSLFQNQDRDAWTKEIDRHKIKRKENDVFLRTNETNALAEICKI